MNVESRRKEGNVDREKHRQRAPPRIDPHEGRRLYQEDFDDGKEGGIHQREEQAIVDADDFQLRIGGRNLLIINPATENIKLISMPTPISSRKAVPVGTVHRAWPLKC